MHISKHHWAEGRGETDNFVIKRRFVNGVGRWGQTRAAVERHVYGRSETAGAEAGPTAVEESIPGA